MGVRLLLTKLAEGRRGADVVAAGVLNGQSHFDCCAATRLAAPCRGGRCGTERAWMRVGKGFALPTLKPDTASHTQSSSRRRPGPVRRSGCCVGDSSFRSRATSSICGWVPAFAGTTRICGEVC